MKENKNVVERFRQFWNVEPSRREYVIVTSAMMMIAAIAAAAVIVAQAPK